MFPLPLRSLAISRFICLQNSPWNNTHNGGEAIILKSKQNRGNNLDESLRKMSSQP
jgi:hypothetical protein